MRRGSKRAPSPVMGWAPARCEADRKFFNQSWNDMVSSPFRDLFAIQGLGIVPSAQTERRGGAGPVRGLLGGKGPPATL